MIRRSALSRARRSFNARTWVAARTVTRAKPVGGILFVKARRRGKRTSPWRYTS